MRPAEVCGCVSRPSDSSSASSPRTVEAETPSPELSTTVFEPTGSTNTSSIRLPDGSSSRGVVWWDDVLVIAARATTAAHVVVSDLPVPELRLHRERTGFRVGATSADLSIERGSIEVPLTQEVLTYPCRLVVRVEISEADILRQQFASRGRESVSDHCVLDLRVVGP